MAPLGYQGMEARARCVQANIRRSEKNVVYRAASRLGMFVFLWGQFASFLHYSKSCGNALSCCILLFERIQLHAFLFSSISEQGFIFMNLLLLCLDKLDPTRFFSILSWHRWLQNDAAGYHNWNDCGSYYIYSNKYFLFCRIKRRRD